MRDGNNNLIIGQGTHGKILIDLENKTMVIKLYYNNIEVKNCEKLQNEYEVQNELFNDFSSSLPFIRIPMPYCFTISSNNSSYKMERIYPYPGYPYYLILNLFNENYDKKFIHSKLGYEVGTRALINKYGIDVHNLVLLIGKVFSYLHFNKNYDGYDCELIHGSNSYGEPKLYLIDFDKIQKFKFELGIIVYRKIDEYTIEEKRLTNVNKLAWFLFGALISMSLVPSENELKEQFINGYSIYVDPTNILMVEVHNNIVLLIQDYMA
jgi:hypothetical protein